MSTRPSKTKDADKGARHDLKEETEKTTMSGEKPKEEEHKEKHADEVTEGNSNAGTEGNAESAGGATTAELSQEDEAMNVKYMRLAADFQNYKRRIEKEKSDIYAYANEKIVGSLLDVIDNFERALDLSSDTTFESFSKGMELIFKQLQDVLNKNEVEEIHSLGEEFDPAIHHAVMMEESEKYESGKVSDVLKKGYKLKEKVIRPAMVKVAQ
jgi:molecular chaperone GrpE